MALLTMEIPEKLMTKLRSTGRPIEDVVVETLEEKFIDKTEEDDADINLSREEVFRRLLESGYIRKPEEFDSPVVQEWLALSEEERQQHRAEVSALYFPDSPASNYIIDSRR
ncbi:MAG: hypothetical protein KDE53_18540 [Caldilineaceae bacterium]|nr:hypothetical protein [Caldilineaceae bacterium]MCB0122285.1 hypothetical protein [Caldilineaceae bacterium]